MEIWIMLWSQTIHGHRTASISPKIVQLHGVRTAPVRYVTTQEKILKNRPVPERLSHSPVICKSLKSYGVSFMCDHSIIRTDRLTHEPIAWGFDCSSSAMISDEHFN